MYAFIVKGDGSGLRMQCYGQPWALIREAPGEQQVLNSGLNPAAKNTGKYHEDQS